MLATINLSHWVSLSPEQEIQRVMHGDVGIPTRGRACAARTLSTHEKTNTLKSQPPTLVYFQGKMKRGGAGVGRRF